MKKILYICTAFYPENAIGSIRNTKLVKYLHKLGYDVTVISPELDTNIKIDKTLYFKELEEIKHLNVSYGRFFRKIFLTNRNKIKNSNKKFNTNNRSANKRSFIRDTIKRKIILYMQEIYTLTRNKNWKEQVIKFLRKNPELKGFDYVVSGYPSLSAHLLAEYVVERGIAKKWICDFRDPIAYESLNSKLYYLFNKQMQKKICQKADVITHVTENMKIGLSKGIDDKSKFHYLPNGYDDDDIAVINDSSVDIDNEFNGHLRLAYVGSLYGGKRDLSVIFEKIKYLNEKSIIDKKKVKFIYAGKDFNVLYNQAKLFGMESILIDMGFVSREDSLAIQKQASVVIVNTWNTEQDKGILTGKVYECFLLEKPTIAVINGTVPNSELGNMITKSGLGLKYDTMINNPDEDQRLMKFIVDLYLSETTNSNLKIDIDTTFIEDYNYVKIVKGLSDIISSLN